jgi:hypothetical protein
MSLLSLSWILEMRFTLRTYTHVDSRLTVIVGNSNEAKWARNITKICSPDKIHIENFHIWILVTYCWQHYIKVCVPSTSKAELCLMSEVYKLIVAVFVWCDSLAWMGVSLVIVLSNRTNGPIAPSGLYAPWTGMAANRIWGLLAAYFP